MPRGTWRDLDKLRGKCSEALIIIRDQCNRGTNYVYCIASHVDEFCMHKYKIAAAVQSIINDKLEEEHFLKCRQRMQIIF